MPYFYFMGGGVMLSFGTHTKTIVISTERK